MLYASRSAQRRRMGTGRIWLVAGYVVAAALLLVVAVAACRAQADRVGDELTGVVVELSPTLQSAAPAGGAGTAGGD